jgi:hypothetical protein
VEGGAGRAGEVDNVNPNQHRCGTQQFRWGVAGRCMSCCGSMLLGILCVVAGSNQCVCQCWKSWTGYRCTVPALLCMQLTCSDIGIC